MPIELSVGRSPQYQPTINFVEDSPPRIPRVDLNTASVADLRRLPGINLASARKIASARKKQRFNHVHDIVQMKLVSKTTFERIRKMVRANGNDDPYVYDLTTQPERVLYRKPFRLNILFDDSNSGLRLVRLELDSVSYSVDLSREVTTSERRQGRITFDLPAMEAGVMNVQISLYDDAGNKDYLTRTLPIFHNPPTVTFFPSERSLRLSRGAALKKSDGNFHCDTGFFFFNTSSSTVTLNRNMSWRIYSQSGSILESGTVDFGFNVVLGPGAFLTGFLANFTFPFDDIIGRRLQAKEEIRTEFEFTESGSGALVSDDLTWRVLLGPDVNIIRVGPFNSEMQTIIFRALRNSVSSIYQQQDLDIGTITTWDIPHELARDYIFIDSDGEASNLTRDWTMPNDSMDLFVVPLYWGDVYGLSQVTGPCDKDGKGMNGSVVEWHESQQLLGVIMAHELGHYLGLEHTNSANNLMNPGIDESTTGLTLRQGDKMKLHCFIRFLG